MSAAVLVLATLLAGAPARELPFDDGGWQTDGEAAVETVDGRATLALQTGGAVRRDVQLEDGTIEFDLKFTRRRSSVYVPVDLAALPAPPQAEVPGAVRAWALSKAVAGLDVEGVPVLPGPAQVGALRRVETREDGLLELHRHLTLAAGQREATAVARVRVHAVAAGVRAFDLGFSDRATVFLNGAPVFRGEASYSYAGRREGLIGYDQARLYLPLRAGENDLLVVLSDSFGGMGLMGRFPDPAGLDVVAR